MSAVYDRYGADLGNLGHMFLRQPGQISGICAISVKIYCELLPILN